MVWVYALSPDPHQQPCRGWSPLKASPVGCCREHLWVCSPPSTRVCLWAIWKKPLTLIHPLLLRKTAQTSSEGNSPSASGPPCSPCLEVVAPRWWHQGGELLLHFKEHKTQDGCHGGPVPGLSHWFLCHGKVAAAAGHGSSGGVLCHPLPPSKDADLALGLVDER